MKRNLINVMGTFAVLFLAGLLSPVALAQSTAFTYQGRLNANGATFSGNAEFQPTLWDAVSGGSMVTAHSPVSIIVTATNGLFQLPLDFGAAPFAAGSNLWLQLEVRTTIGPFAVLSPRHALTAAPYAIAAGHLTRELPASQLSGVLPAAALTGIYSNAVIFNNVGNAFAGSGAGLSSLNAGNLSAGTLNAARLPATAARLDLNQTFSGVPAFNGGTSGVSAPFSVDSISVVTNLNADFLDGQSGVYYQSASNLLGTVPPSAIADSSITGEKLAGDTNSLLKVSGGRLAISAERVFLPQVSSSPIDTNAFTGLGFQYYWGSGEGAIMSSYASGQGYLAFYTKAHGTPVSRRMIINQEGRVGINTDSPGAYFLYVNGNAFANGTWGSSDARLKTNVHSLTHAVELIQRLRGVRYEWRGEAFPGRALDPGPQLGFLAQEVEAVFPELIKTDASGFKALAYDKLTAVLVEGLKEQQIQIEALQSRNRSLERSVAALEVLADQPRQDAELRRELAELRQLVNSLTRQPVEPDQRAQ